MGGEGFNPFPCLIVFNTIRISVTLLIASISPGDRFRDSLGGVCIHTNGTNTHGPTARRRARTLALRGAPRGTVGDVPTAVGGEVAVTARRMRARACGELRLTRPCEYGILPLM